MYVRKGISVMKKIMLSLSICVVYMGCIGDATAAQGKSCQRLITGAVICGSIPTGGGYEQDKCIESKFAKNTMYKGSDSLLHCAATDGKVWKKPESLCNPSNAPENSGRCLDAKKSFSFSALDTWANKGKKVGDSCLSGPSKTVTEPITSCAAKYCNDGYLLYTTNTRSEIPVKGYSGRVASQGICVSRASLEQWCEKNGSCPDDEKKKCVLNEIVVENYGRDVSAYIGEEICKCVDDERTCAELYPNDTAKQKCCEANGNWNDAINACDCPDDLVWNPEKQQCEKKKQDNGDNEQPDKKPGNNPTLSDCDYGMSVEIRCGNGKTYTEYMKFKLTNDEVDSLLGGNRDQCKGVLSKSIYEKVEDYKNKAKELCKTKIKAELEIAQSEWEAFMHSAKSNRSQWKNQEGNFNTARLMSDATAAVVLGTVGGVVSTKIIKKKQLEKGYDVLHCTIGGQTVADWGDEFSVGLQR